MKLKKGSLEAKRFMAKIRAKKGKPKKISGVKKPSVKKTHTDIKSHNYKISISGNSKNYLIYYRKLAKNKYYVATSLDLIGIGIEKIGEIPVKNQEKTYLFSSSALKKVQNLFGKENTKNIK